MNYDLVVRGGTVIDPSQGLHKVADVGISRGRVAAIGSRLEAPPGARLLDARGKYVCPGLIDIHTHIYPYVTTWGVEADPTCLARGVTTPVDAGSSSWVTFAGFRELSIRRSRARVLGYIHISGIGLVYGPAGEMLDMRFAAPEETAACIEENRDAAVGVKVRQGRFQVGSNGVEPLRLAVKAAEMVRTGVMVHIGLGVPLPDVLAQLRPGDVVTHCYQGQGDGILDGSGKLLPPVVEARRRGVLFDVGHGAGSLKFDVVRSAFEQHFLPDVISSDLHSLNQEGPVFDLITTMSKFLHFGMGLDDVIEKTTVAAARAIGREGALGSLAVGREADLAVLETEEGAFDLKDTHGNVIQASRLIRCASVVRGGEVIDPSAYAGYRPRPPKPVEWRVIGNLDKIRPDIYSQLERKRT
ncbi:MAG: amidohydrolase/deacetylase family metallohydrolase [Planctomycetes bacterium]|nr:amidohydrolase/deacetylase family metallohydrolase [Planctomycetota bacterium]